MLARETVHIQQFVGMSGGFATKESFRYRVILVGTEGSLKTFNGLHNWGFDLEGAEETAAEYARLFGWPIARQREVRITRTELRGVDAFDESPKSFREIIHGQ